MSIKYCNLCGNASSVPVVTHCWSCGRELAASYGSEVPPRDRASEIFITVRIEHLRKTVEEVRGAALPEDVVARDKIIDALKAQGFTILATGEGTSAEAWVKLPNDAAGPAKSG